MCIKKGKIMKVLKLSLILISITVFQVTASEEKLLTTEQWLEDFEFVISKLKSHHPNLYYKINIWHDYQFILII